MDVVKYIKEKRRMCNNYRRCIGCPLYENDLACVGDLDADAVALVEKWSNDHPIVTNRQKLLEVFGMEFCYSSVMKSEWLNAEYKAPKGEE